MTAEVSHDGRDRLGPLTPADLDRLATAIPHSTIPETVGAIVDSTTP